MIIVRGAPPTVDKDKLLVISFFKKKKSNNKQEATGVGGFGGSSNGTKETLVQKSSRLFAEAQLAASTLLEVLIQFSIDIAKMHEDYA